MTVRRRVLSIGLLAAVVAAQLVVVFTADVRPGLIVVDFHNAYYPAAEHVLDGERPYRGAGADFSDLKAYVNPPTVALLVSPLTLLPPERADLMWLMVLIDVLAATLLLSGVPSRVALVLAVIALPVLSALQTGSITLVLALLLALTWRYRDRTYLPGVFIGAAIALKLYLWPLTIWFLATRRYRSAGIACALGAVGFLSVLPFVSLREYIAMVNDFTDFSAPDTYTIYALLAELGAPHGAARVIGLAVGLAVLIAGRRSFATCVVASLLITPVVWMHFFTLLAVALAAASAPIAAWALLPMFWVGAGKGNGATWQLALVLALVGAVLYVVRPRVQERWRRRRQLEPAASYTAEQV